MQRNRSDAASSYFALATKADRNVISSIRDLRSRFEKQDAQRPRKKSKANPPPSQQEDETTPSQAQSVTPPVLPPQPTDSSVGHSIIRLSPAEQTALLETYRNWGNQTQSAITSGTVLIETDNFLIWTDWTEDWHPQLADWCESMYRHLRDYFDMDPTQNVFLAKCPVFCWKSKQRFERFARTFDGHNLTNATGYSRSIEQSGHTHVVAYRTGLTDADLDRFASTLTHEGVHAFVHRFHSHRLIPHWVNEGLAEMVTERILTHRTPAGENARMLAKAYVRHDWPLQDMLRYAGPILVHEYPLAHSVVLFLDETSPAKFKQFVINLKNGMTLEPALAQAYDGMTFDQLESDWRKWAKQSDNQHMAEKTDS